MKRGMETVVPGMRVVVESVITQSLSKKELDPRYIDFDVVGPSPVIEPPIGLTEGIHRADATAIGLTPATEMCIR